MTLHKSNQPKQFRAEYNAVKNHIHNTLKLTKEDIQQIIKETVQEEVKRITKHGDIWRIVEKVVESEIYEVMGNSRYWNRDGFRSKVAGALNDGVTKVIREQLAIDVQVIKKNS